MSSTVINQAYIDALPQIAHSADKLETLLDPIIFKERLIQEIRQAQHRICILALYLQDDEAGREILDALFEAKKAKPELKVDVLVDWHRAQRGLIGAAVSEGNASLYRKYLKSYGDIINIVGVPVRNRELLGVLHLKGFIIDDMVIYSGASINNVYLGFEGRYRYDRYHVIQNKQLADSMLSFIEKELLNHPAVGPFLLPKKKISKDFKHSIRHLRINLNKAKYIFKPETIKDMQIGLTPLVGVGRRKNRLNKTILKLLASAEKSLVIFTPYFNFPLSIKRELKKAIRRGVEITIIVGDKTANDFYAPPTEKFKAIHALPYLYELNLRNFTKVYKKEIQSQQLKINIWKHKDNSFHLKGMWVDCKYMLITGNNLNPRAWKLDLENAVLIHDKNKNLQQQNQIELENILKNTILLNSFNDLDDINSYPIEVQKLIKRLKRVKIDALLKQVL